VADAASRLRQTGSRSYLLNRLKLAAYKLAAAAVRPLTPPVSYALASLIGSAAFRLAPSPRYAVESNLRHVLGPNAKPIEVAAAAECAFRSVARNYVDLVSAPQLDANRLRSRRVEIHGYEHLAAALAERRGVIIATAHYGCPEIALQAALAWGIEILVLTEPIEPPELSELFDRRRASHGHRLMTVGLSAGKEALRTLRRGGAVLLVIDRDIQGHGVVIEYFGAPARMPTGAVELARRSGALIIPGLSHRIEGTRAVIELGAPVDLVDSGNRRTDDATNVRRVLERFEGPIRSDPGQWLVLERLWAPYTASATDPEHPQ
jgi:phosphatidylinositol dimannoside acyltransferase